MLIKAVNLNLGMLKSELELSLCVFLPAILFGPTSFGIWIFLIALLGSIGAQFKGYGKLFGSGIYGEEAELYMTLPLTSDIFVLSKVLIGVIWNTLITTVIMIYLLVIILWEDGMQDLMETLYTALMAGRVESAISPLQGAVTMGLLPLQLVLSAALWCLMILSLQNLALTKNIRRLQSLQPRSLTVISMVIVMGLNQLPRSLFGMISVNVFWASLVSPVLEGALAMGLYIFCRKSFERGYDLK